MKKSDLYPKIKSFTPRIFWRKCDKCQESYKKEKLWYVIMEDGRTFTYCKHCYPNEALLREGIYKSENWFRDLSKLSENDQKLVTSICNDIEYYGRKQGFITDVEFNEVK